VLRVGLIRSSTWSRGSAASHSWSSAPGLADLGQGAWGFELPIATVSFAAEISFL